MSGNEIKSFELFKINLPMGRMIGDCGCAYDAMSVVVLALHTADGLIGWGFGETPRGGRFVRGAEWIVHMPSIAALTDRFNNTFWPRLARQDPQQFALQYATPFAGGDYVERAIRIALADLQGQVLGKPLWSLYGGDKATNRARLYASGLEFNLSHSEAAALHRSFANSGFRAVKVKVGHKDIRHDLKRLQAIREAIGMDIEMAIDANEAWTVDEALKRIDCFQREGMQIAYLEDPILRTELGQIEALSKQSPIDIIGHDYISDIATLRKLLERGALRRLRITADLATAFPQIALAEEFNVPMIAGNTLFEANYHLSAGLASRIERSEFPDLAWNALPVHPIRIENGFAILADAAGHGLAPDRNALERFNDPEESPASEIGKGVA